MNNLLELKALSLELTMRYYLNGGEKNVRKAYKAARLLYKEMPTQQNEEHLEFLKALKDLDEASEYAHRLTLYYEGLNMSESIVNIIESMPKSMQNLPFAWHMYNKHKVPKTWGKVEIRYYASFGKEHFEKWSPKSLAKGLGGSETAVIQLAKEWTKEGYHVTVYCDCGNDEGIYDGVSYINYFKFNPKDNFNIFINWRSPIFAGKIKAKKFIIDLHDLFSEHEYEDYRHYDKLFVKSQYHKSLAKNVPEGKVEVISNGI
jgi:hypothetical protein